MFKNVLSSTLALVFCSVFSFPTYATSDDSVYDVKDFFKNPDATDYKLSSDGRYIAYVKSGFANTGGSRLNIYVQELTENGILSGSEKRLTDEKLRDISGFIWKSTDTLLYFTDTNGDENYHVYALNIKTGKAIDLTPFERTRAEVIDILPADDTHVLISHNQRNPTVFDVYRININNGKSERIIKNPGNITGWITDHNGIVRLAISTDGLKTTLFYRENEKTPPRIILQNSFKTVVRPLFFDTDNTKFYAISNRGRDKLALVLINPTSPDEENVIYETDNVDLNNAFYSSNHKKLIAVNWYDEKYQVHFFDNKISSVYKKIKRHFPGEEVRIQADDDGKYYVVHISSDRSAGSYYLYNDLNELLTKIADLSPQLKKADMAPMKPISYTSRDGLTIHGYLTLPPSKNPKNLACIINPHGGPEDRDVWGYKPEVQFLASQGYCVLQMNFRGSTGYGRSFWLAGYGQWGLKMQDDITDGVQWLIKQGIADPKRIGIYGISYGGYATLAGIAFTPDLYAAAVDYVGVSNLFTLLESTPPYWRPLLERQYEMIGHPQRDKERLIATSPLLHSDKIKTPLFIAQGANDPRVNKSQSDEMVTALRKRGVTVEYMVKDNEGHGFANEENRIDFYHSMQVFLAEHLKP